MKKKIKTWKYLTIKIEKVVEITKDKETTEHKNLYWLVNATYQGGGGIGFRANTEIDCWAKLMQEVYLG